MKLKKMRKIVNSNFGFSLIEIMISVGLLSVVTLIGLKQSGMISGSMFNMGLDRQIDEMQSSMTSLLAKKKACDNTFLQGQAILGKEYAELRDENNVVVYQENSNYLDGQVKITDFKVKLINGSPSLEVEIDKIGKQAKTKNIHFNVPLLINLDSFNSVIDCFSLSDSINPTVKFKVAQKICENTYGKGTDKYNQMFNSDPSNPSCSFDGMLSDTNCDPGQSLTSLVYNQSTMSISAVCSAPFTGVNCDKNWIKKVNPNGTFECATLGDHIDRTAITFNAGDTCRLAFTPDDTVKISCITNVVAVNGACNNSVTNSCSVGNFSDRTDSSTNYLWSCTGSNGGSTASCSKAKPINGVCNNTTVNSCSVGSLSDQTDSSTYYLWSCTGSNGGSNASCSKAKSSYNWGGIIAASCVMTNKAQCYSLVSGYCKDNNGSGSNADASNCTSTPSQASGFGAVPSTTFGCQNVPSNGCWRKKLSSCPSNTNSCLTQPGGPVGGGGTGGGGTNGGCGAACQSDSNCRSGFSCFDGMCDVSSGHKC